MTVTRQRIVILVLAMLFAAGAVFLAFAATPNKAEAAKAGGVTAQAVDDQGEDGDEQ